MPIRPVQIQKNGIWVELPDATAVKVGSNTYEVTISGIFEVAPNLFDKDSLRVDGLPTARTWCSNHTDDIVVLEVEVDALRCGPWVVRVSLNDHSMGHPVLCDALDDAFKLANLMLSQSRPYEVTIVHGRNPKASITTTEVISDNQREALLKDWEPLLGSG